jgi:MinD superfamily P-loop ATPase
VSCATIAVASGKGGTGKTTVATNLAVALAADHQRVQVLDCDVEEPNCHLFLKPTIVSRHAVTSPLPVVDQGLCNACGECERICQFSAIVCVKETVLTFPELCHSCGGCALVCPTGAIAEEEREIGVVEKGTAEGMAFGHGRMRVREAISPPVIAAVKEHVDPEALTIIDAPPGTSCPVIEAVRGVGYLVLVTEPTPFGLNDLILAVEMARALGLPMGVVVNRCTVGDARVERYCEREGVPIIGRIPDDRRVAEAYSRGDLALRAVPEFAREIRALAGRLMEAAPA